MAPSATVGSLLIKLGLDTRGVQQGVKEAEGAFSGLANKANIAAGIAGGLVGNAMFSSMQTMVAFDDRMREIFSIMPGITAEAMAGMEREIRSASVRLGVSAEGLAGGVYNAISSGIDPTQVTQFMEVATKASIAGVSDTTSAAAVLSATLNAYGQDASHATEVADLLFNAVKLGVTTFPELAASMSNVSPAAAVLGVSLEETTAALAAMTLQGVPTAEAATKIAATMTLLQKGTPELNKVLAANGYANGQAALDALGYQGTLEMLRNTADRMGIAIPKMTGRVEAAGAIFTLTGENAAKANEILASTADVTGSVDAAFEVMNEGVGGQVRRLQAAMQDISLSIGQALEPVAPLFMAFGPQLGQYLSMGLGAAFGVGVKGLGAIAKKAMPGLTAAMAEMGAEAGGSLAKGLGVSMVNHMKGAGFKKMLAGGLAMAGGVALQQATAGMDTPAQAAGAAAGAAMTIAGAFAVGGPVMAGIAAITLMVQQLIAFMDQVGAAQADLAGKAAEAANQSAQEAIVNLGNLTTKLEGMQGAERVLADTFGGKEMMEGLRNLGLAIKNAKTMTAAEAASAIEVLNRAVVEAEARGNAEVANELRGFIVEVETYREVARAATDGVYRSLEEGAVEGGADAAGAVALSGRELMKAYREQGQQLRKSMAQTAETTSGMWDVISDALSKGPEIKSFKERMSEAGNAIRENARMLAKAIRVGDTVGASVYANRLGQAQTARRKLRATAEGTLSDAATVLGRYQGMSRRKHKGVTKDVEKEAKRAARIALREGRNAAEALPDELEGSKTDVAAAADDVTGTVSSEMAWLVPQAMTYGSHAGSTYAAGLRSQIPAVQSASLSLAQAAAQYIKMSEPPKKGALSTIKTWGPHLVDNWVKPMGRHTVRASEAGRRLAAAMADGMSAADGRFTPAPITSPAFRRFGPIEATPHRGGEVHIHVGTLIANEAGLDELKRRMEKRVRMTMRDRRYVGDEG